ncbi:FAD-binding oxidoreductase [Ancylobacter vacuolatus]|uniref:FAD/FMN-containing dehydrogenase n=1 Tax=Ancylobacter vacuolatus TaxID=223389 RepID=A0ABU0DG72_9HYPH|nr:FAD-binding oxidoreductase [Ancylobacter vacuolatus]MDQ0347420.1 FAD/FMN-containing dehydrogenase [Ancylobacter vacuolatus]
MTSTARLSRRSLIMGTAASAALAGFAPLRAQEASTQASTPASTQPAPVPPPSPPVDRWQALARLTDGAVLRPSDAGFLSEALPNNLRFRHVRPEAIVRCRTPEMIGHVLSWCQDYEVPFAVRGGGHSYAGFSTTHGLLIDMSAMNAITYDPATGRAKVGAGAINQPIYDALRQAGRMMTHGRCPTVGVAGFVLGGGIGFNMRRLGVASDMLVASEIVTADGRVRTLSATEEPDLFWATRGGGGGNFGVSTSFTFETVPADSQLTAFRIVWRQKTLAVARALFATLDGAPVTLGTRISLAGVTPTLHAGGRQVGVTLLGQFAGDRQAFEKLLQPVMAVAAPERTDIRELPYWEAQEFLMEPGAPAWYRERSAFLDTAPSEAFLEKAFHHLVRWPGTGAHGDLFFFQTGGRINEIAPAASAFVHRGSRWLAVAGVSWSEDDTVRPEIVRAAKKWQDELYHTVGHAGGHGAFINFPDTSLVDWRARYYGANSVRLAEIKAQIDPGNLFSFPQAV